MKGFLSLLLVLIGGTYLTLAAADKEPAAKSEDKRLGEPKTLNGYFPMKVPESKAAWEKRRKELREQVLVATGLWPLPEKTPLHPVIHGKIDRDDYTVEKVFFASYPGHYVSGSLYRPKASGQHKLPGVLCPHGHWQNGRFYDAGEKAAEEQIKIGAEKTVEGARYPLQARCAMLARMGCVVFHYDMVGVADSQPIGHRLGFADAEAELRLQSFMGLQTWNSIRSLDFLLSLPEVDPARIGVTGASGGGTQTFMLCAVDDRPTVAFPAVMVSTAMQGGCVCENCSYLRQNTGNIELAALFAPKPLAMSGADDWTKEIEKKGLPELKALYKLYDAEDRVAAKCWPQFQHNYNQVSREFMYTWFNKHFNLGQPEPVVEKPFVPVPPRELSVYDEQHPRPSDTVDAGGLRKYLTAAAAKQMADLQPKNAASLAKYREVVGTALRVMVGGGLPDKVEARSPQEEKIGDVTVHRSVLTRPGEGDAVPSLGLVPPGFNGTVTIWIHPKGRASLLENGKIVPAAQAILEMKSAIMAIDCLRTGEQMGDRPYKVDDKFAGFTFGYNRPLLAERVRDILTAVATVKTVLKPKKINLIGWKEAGPWALLARALCDDAVANTAVDLNGFAFDDVRNTSESMMLPGALKYAGVQGLAMLCAPGKLYVHNDAHAANQTELIVTFARLGGTLVLRYDLVDERGVIDWLLK
jgi:dienelactone hydrolase